MSEQSMVERVAKAIGDTFTAQHDRIVNQVLSKPSRAATTATVDDVLVLCARAAIEAMKEPTFDMVEAPAVLFVGPEDADDVWRAMLSAALSEQQP